MAPLGDGNAGARSSQPASSVSASGQRRRKAARHAQHREAVGELRAGAAEVLRHPGQRQPGVLPSAAQAGAFQPSPARC